MDSEKFIIEIAKAISINGKVNVDRYSKVMDLVNDFIGSKNVQAERFDAEKYLNEKDIWNHPIITDRTDKNSYEVADLMAGFANYYAGKGSS